jgi:hypothetical protein
MDILSWVIPIPLRNLFVAVLTGGLEKAPHILRFFLLFKQRQYVPFKFLFIFADDGYCRVYPMHIETQSKRIARMSQDKRFVACPGSDISPLGGSQIDLATPISCSLGGAEAR